MADALEVLVEDDGSIVENWQGRREPALRAAALGGQVGAGHRAPRPRCPRTATATSTPRSRVSGRTGCSRRSRSPWGRERAQTCGDRTGSRVRDPGDERYKGQVHRYGLYNEPNITGWFPDMPVDWKARAYRDSSPPATPRRVRRPSAQLLMADLAPGKGAQFLRTLFCLDALRSAGRPLREAHRRRRRLPPLPVQLLAETRGEASYQIGIGRIDEISTAARPGPRRRAALDTVGRARRRCTWTSSDTSAAAPRARRSSSTSPKRFVRHGSSRPSNGRATSRASSRCTQYGLYETPHKWSGIWDMSIIDRFGPAGRRLPGLQTGSGPTSNASPARCRTRPPAPTPITGRAAGRLPDTRPVAGGTTPRPPAEGGANDAGGGTGGGGTGGGATSGGGTGGGATSGGGTGGGATGGGGTGGGATGGGGTGGGATSGGGTGGGATGGGGTGGGATSGGGTGGGATSGGGTGGGGRAGSGGRAGGATPAHDGSLRACISKCLPGAVKRRFASAGCASRCAAPRLA